MMIQVRVAAIGLVVSVVSCGAAFGQPSPGPDATEAGASVDLTTDFSKAFTNGPLAFDGGSAAAYHTDKYVFATGAYVVGYFGASTIEGDMDGATIMSAPDLPDLLFVPDLETGYGFGVGLGWRIEKFAFELNYMRSTYDTDFGGAPLGDAVLNAFNFDVKYFFSTNDVLQPFVLVGLVLPWLDVENGSLDPGIPLVTDANYTGVGANLGGGLNFYITPKIALVFQAGYRVMYFTSVKGTSDDRRSIDDNLDASGFFATGGVSFSF